MSTLARTIDVMHTRIAVDPANRAGSELTRKAARAPASAR